MKIESELDTFTQVLDVKRAEYSVHKNLEMDIITVNLETGHPCHPMSFFFDSQGKCISDREAEMRSFSFEH